MLSDQDWLFPTYRDTVAVLSRGVDPVEAFSLRSVKLRHYKGPLHTVPFGDLKAITNYSREELTGRLVLAVVNFPPRQIGPVRSEVLTLGTYSNDVVLLVDPGADAQPGDRLG